MADTEIELAALQLKIEDAEETLSVQNAKLDRVRVEIQLRESELQRRSEELNDSMSKISGAEVTLEELENRKAVTQNSVDNLMEELAQLEADIEISGVEHANAITQLADRQAEKSDLEDELAELGALQAQFNVLLAEVDLLSARKGQLEAELPSLEDKLKVEKAKLASEQYNAVRETQRVVALAGEIASLEVEVNQLLKSRDNFQAQELEAKEAAQAAREHLLKLNEDQETVRAQVAALTEQLASLNDWIKLSDQLTSLQERLNQQNDEFVPTDNEVALEDSDQPVNGGE